MHVILVIENLSFPRDRRVRQEALALVSAGYKVSVVCPQGLADDTAFHEVVTGIDVYRYPQPWQGRGILTYALEYGWALLCTVFLVLAILARDGFDVIHAANPPDIMFLVALPFKLLGKKFVYDQHDLSPEMLEEKFPKQRSLLRILFFLERCSYQLANLVIVTNESFREIACARGRVHPAKVSIVRNGPDIRDFTCVAAAPELRKGGTFLCVYAGVMNNQDGVDRVIRALHHIIHVRERRDIRFALLGTGDSLFSLQRLARDLNVESFIDFTGWLGDRELISYLSTADVCLAPDPPDRLNNLLTTIKIMEYMSCGKPIVSFDLLESRRSAGGAAIYVDGDDPAKFGDAVIMLVSDKAMREQMGAEGLHRIRTELHWGRSKETLLAAYQTLSGTVRRGLTTSPGRTR